jgi:PKHD-type hydroxylase
MQFRASGNLRAGCEKQMILELLDVLSEAELGELRDLAARSTFIDGRASNVGFAEKLNLQADPNAASTAAAAKVVSAALMRTSRFAEFAFPKRMLPPMLTRYTVGMKYGPHADAALLASKTGPLRSDLSATIFLNDPAAYEGGELVLHMGARSLPMKSKAGGAIIYPSTTLHEVAPVRSGERLVAITFIESFIPEEADRDIVFEIGEISALEGENMHWANRMRLEVVRQNLTRRWSGR